ESLLFSVSPFVDFFAFVLIVSPCPSFRCQLFWSPCWTILAPLWVLGFAAPPKAETLLTPFPYIFPRKPVSYSPILFVHILGGSLGLLSGTAAILFRKGSPRHILAGRIFVASMLTMGAAATYLGIVRNQPSNVGGGIMTFYLVTT